MSDYCDPKELKNFLDKARKNFQDELEGAKNDAIGSVHFSTDVDKGIYGENVITISASFEYYNAEFEDDPYHYTTDVYKGKVKTLTQACVVTELERLGLDNGYSDESAGWQRL